MATPSERPAEIPAYMITNIALNSLAAAGTCGLWVASLVRAHGLHDPARSSFVWAKVASPLFVLGFLLSIVSYAYVIPTITAVTEGKIGYAHYEVSTRLDDLSWLFHAFAQIGLILCLSELGLGLYLVAEGKRKGLQSVIRCVFAALAGGCWLIAVAYYALETRFVGDFYAGWVRGLDLRWWQKGGLEELHLVRKVQGVFVILVWAVSISLVGQSLMTLHLVRTSGCLQRVAKLYVAACLTWLVPSTWELAQQVRWLLREDYDMRALPLYLEIIKGTLGSLPVPMVFLCIIFIERKQRGGVWTPKEEWVSDDSD